MLSTSRALAWEHSCKIVSRNVRCRRAKPRQQRRPHVVSRVDLSGRWSKDRENSELDAYENMLSLLGLNGIKKVAAVQLISGLEIEQATSPPHFTVRYIVSRVQFLQNVERFAFDQQNEMPRRDGQAGSQTATLTQLSTGIQTVTTWGEPNPVTLTETYTKVQQDTLITEAKAQAGSRTLCCKQVLASHLLLSRDESVDSFMADDQSTFFAKASEGWSAKSVLA